MSADPCQCLALAIAYAIVERKMAWLYAVKSAARCQTLLAVTCLGMHMAFDTFRATPVPLAHWKGEIHTTWIVNAGTCSLPSCEVGVADLHARPTYPTHVQGGQEHITPWYCGHAATDRTSRLRQETRLLDILEQCAAL